MEWLNEPCEFIHDEATYRCMRVKDTPFQHQIVCCGSMPKSKFEHCNRLNLRADSIHAKECRAKVRNRFCPVTPIPQIHGTRQEELTAPRVSIIKWCSLVNIFSDYTDITDSKKAGLFLKKSSGHGSITDSKTPTFF